MICVKDIVILVGGRNNINTSNNQITLDVYNLINSEWYFFKGINRFRHVSWLSYSNLFTHGGFENQ